MKNGIRISRTGVLLGLAWWLAALPGYADSTQAGDAFMKGFEEVLQADSALPHPVQQWQMTGNPVYDSVLLDARAQQLLFGMHHQNRCFSFQYYSSIVIFLMVLVIVGSGLYLSFRQFRLNEKMALRAAARNEAPAESGGETSLEISAEGVKVNSAVMGILILTLSLAFFFLYLRFVYHIEVIDPNGSTPATEQASETKPE